MVSGLMIYPHPLDYVTGIKYTVTNMRLPLEFRITSENFYVKELVDLNNMGFNPEKGEYAVLKIRKRNLEMFKALELTAEKLGVPVSNFYFYGVKDKNATTESYLFIKSKLVDKSNFPLIRRNLEVELIGFTSIKPRRIHFRGNYFKVAIHSSNEEHLLIVKKIISELVEKGLPSYYGYQRFGSRRYNSHILGKYILLGREDLFSEQFLKTIYLREDIEPTISRFLGNYDNLIYEKTYVKSRVGQGVRVVLKKLHNMLIDAYASYLFNLLLNSLIETRGYHALSSKLPMPGCEESVIYYEPVIYSEGLSNSILGDLPCYHRVGLFKPLNNAVNKQNEYLVYEFQLEPGMYASVVLREIFKDKLVFGE